MNVRPLATRRSGLLLVEVVDGTGSVATVPIDEPEMGFETLPDPVTAYYDDLATWLAAERARGA
jgi:hypothetical protein